MPYEFKMTHRVEFAETDMAGIVHFSNFFRMMEAAEHAFFRSLGFSIHDHDETGTTGWPRVSASCDYQRPLRFEDEVEIHLLVAEVRSRSIRYVFIFRKVGEEVDAARGEITAVCAGVEKSMGKLAAKPIPEAIRAKISAAPEELLQKAPRAA
jgi:YbgC/YbaW family acyl-CoA thioester hydrolase